MSRKIIIGTEESAKKRLYWEDWLSQDSFSGEVGGLAGGAGRLGDAGVPKGERRDRQIASGTRAATLTHTHHKILLIIRLSGTRHTTGIGSEMSVMPSLSQKNASIVRCRVHTMCPRDLYDLHGAYL